VSGSLEFNISDLKEINYAVISVKLKSSKVTDDDHELTGLFIGMQPLVPHNTAIVSTDEMYIWMRKGNYCHMLNVKHYEVDKIYMGKDKSAYEFTGKHDDLDKEKSRLIIIHKAMKDAGRIGPNGLIDISTYKDIPANIQADIDKGVDKTKNTSRSAVTGSHHTKNSGTHHQAACGYTGHSTYKAKETSTRGIKRTTRYSPAEAIANMWNKILEIQAGTYKAPKLRVLKEDKEEAKKKATASESEDTTGHSQPKQGPPSNASTNLDYAEELAYWGLVGGAHHVFPGTS